MPVARAIQDLPLAELGRLSLRNSSMLILTVCAYLWSTDRAGYGCYGNENSAPNIVLIVADDLGFGELGCYGQKRIKTPHIDALARDGMRLTQFYSGAPVCAPARCVLMTGKHSGHAHVRNNGNPAGLDDLRREFGWEFPGQNPIPAEEVTIAELLQARGYATAAIGKWGLGHFGTTGDPTTQGFDLFYGYNCQGHAHNHYPRFLWRNRTKEELPGNDDGATGETHSQERFTAEALKFIRVHQEGPFFLYLPLTIPHVSIQVPDAELEQYKGMPETKYAHRDNYKPHPRPHAAYAAMVSYMDKAIGEILAEIDALKLADNTLVIFTSDNGPTHDRVGGADSDFFESSGPLRGRKGSVYEGGIRVPLIARWPEKIQAGSQSDHIAAFWDVLPTLCDVAGVDSAKRPKEVDGIGFASTLLGEGKQTSHAYLYWEFPSYGGQQAIRAGDWKAVRTELLTSGGRKSPDSARPIKTKLYNLADDLGETKDIARDHPEIVTRLEMMMQNARQPSALFPFKALDP